MAISPINAGKTLCKFLSWKNNQLKDFYLGPQLIFWE